MKIAINDFSGRLVIFLTSCVTAVLLSFYCHVTAVLLSFYCCVTAVLQALFGKVHLFTVIKINKKIFLCEYIMLQRGHLRLIDNCGLYMYTFFFF